MIISSAFRDKKKYICYLSIILLIFVIYDIIFCISKYYEWIINYQLGNQEKNRLLIVMNSNNVLETLNSFEYISYKKPIYKSKEVLYNNKKIKANVFFDEVIINGDKIINSNQVILSNYFNLKQFKNDSIGGKINIKIDDKIFSFEVVGITSNNINDIYFKDDLYLSFQNTDVESYYLLIDQYKNVSSVKEKLWQKGYICDYYDTSGLLEINLIENTLKIYIFIKIIVTIILILAIFIIINNIYSNERKNTAIFKVIGYKIIKIVNIITLRVLLISFIVLIIRCIIYIFIIKFKLINYINYIDLMEIISYNLVLLIIIFMINIIINYIKVKNMPVLKYLYME